MNWSWLPEFAPQLLHGFGITMLVFSASVCVGFVLAVPLALAQIRGGWLLAKLAGGFCSILRGTPLLMQLFLFYYGIGSLFASLPAIRETMPWLVRLDAIWYVLAAFSLNFAAYEAEVLRAALLGVPRGEIEAAESYGLSPLQVLRLVWLPSAILRVYPVLANDVIAQLKTTPIIFTVPVVDMMAVVNRVMQDRLLVYEPLIFIGVIYLILSFLILRFFAMVGRRGPQRWLA
ncbi:MAG: ABC transporter permease subunit [Aestuariivirga sp.]